LKNCIIFNIWKYNVLNFNDLSIQENIDGVSVLPSLLGEAQDFGMRPLYWEFYEMEGWRALRFGDWKAVQHNMHHPDPLPIEIYNIEQDIGETTNLAQDCPEILAMAEQLFLKAHTTSGSFKWGHRMDSLLDK
jgi:arylsulfatase A